MKWRKAKIRIRNLIVTEQPRKGQLGIAGPFLFVANWLTTVWFATNFEMKVYMRLLLKSIVLFLKGH